MRMRPRAAPCRASAYVRNTHAARVGHVEQVSEIS